MLPSYKLDVSGTRFRKNQKMIDAPQIHQPNAGCNHPDRFESENRSFHRYNGMNGKRQHRRGFRKKARTKWPCNR
jgi:hypothetical protein